jgi:hypothetical protein
MEIKNGNTNFVNFGTYRAEEADILKRELEKHGIPVKVIYPGTGIGRGATAEAYFPAYKLMIRVCDISIAEKLKERFNIKFIELGEKMPLPKAYSWAKRGLSRISLIGSLISFFGILITAYLSALEFLPENTPFYFIIAFSIFFFLWLCSTVYNIFVERKRH